MKESAFPVVTRVQFLCAISVSSVSLCWMMVKIYSPLRHRGHGDLHREISNMRENFKLEPYLLSFTMALSTHGPFHFRFTIYDLLISLHRFFKLEFFRSLSRQRVGFIVRRISPAAHVIGIPGDCLRDYLVEIRVRSHEARQFAER